MSSIKWWEMKQASELSKIAKKARNSGPVVGQANVLMKYWQKNCEQTAARGENKWEEKISDKVIPQTVLHKALDGFRALGYDVIVTNRELRVNPYNSRNGETERFVVIRWS